MKPYRYTVIKLSLLLCALVYVSFPAAASAGEEVTKPSIPEGKQTSLGLYLTAAEAYDKWLAAPDAVKVFDVRTLEEYIYVGHAPMAWNIPLAFQTHDWDAEKRQFAMQPNVDFISQVKAMAGPDDTILVMCRSGGRSAKAANVLAQAGFTNVYQITDGMEGDADKDPASADFGKRLKNGWKNSNLPWTYEIDPALMQLTSKQKAAAVKE